MKIKTLQMFLNGMISPNIFALEIASEVNFYKKKSESLGYSMPVYISGENTCIYIGTKQLITICDAFLNKVFNKWHIYYICDALQMYMFVKFSDDCVKEVIYSMSDPEVNYEVNEEIISQIRQTMQIAHKRSYRMDNY